MFGNLMESFLAKAKYPQGLGRNALLWSMNIAHRGISKWGLSFLEIKKDHKILDIGCGGGKNIKSMLEWVDTGKVCGLDISAASVAYSKRVNRRAIGENRAEIKLGGANSIPWPDGEFDRVTAFETVFFWPDPEACFREVARVLKPGGEFQICNSIDPDRNYEKLKYWIDLLEIAESAKTDFAGVLTRAGFGGVKKIASQKYGLVIKGKKPSGEARLN
jgi:ubiquinone/menaquinone biosynthesis C-methylase UbiE